MDRPSTTPKSRRAAVIRGARPTTERPRLIVAGMTSWGTETIVKHLREVGLPGVRLNASPQDVDTALRRDPDARLIHVSRGAVAGLEEAWRRLGSPAELRRDAYEQYYYRVAWPTVESRLSAFEARLGDRYLRLPFEQYERDADAAIAGVMNWLAKAPGAVRRAAA
jgi:hypothetical protein